MAVKRRGVEGKAGWTRRRRIVADFRDDRLDTARRLSRAMQSRS